MDRCSVAVCKDDKEVGLQRKGKGLHGLHTQRTSVVARVPRHSEVVGVRNRDDRKAPQEDVADGVDRNGLDCTGKGRELHGAG